ncbi:hypothetical protein [Rubrolithibacter danxiaensis]|uniref:hypothetical protein n=1 Tax=Rubrolithibacter danxiaensis TaxID=3390805 RepID=UPI003BF8DBFB
MRYWLALLFFSVLVSTGFCQQLDAIGKSDPLKISGSLSSSQIAYFSNRILNRRDPYTFFVSGNLDINVYGWNVPVGFTYSNQSKGSFQQPFNQYNLNPVYKWVTAHIGYTSMSFSSYTLNGHLFAGVGVDLTPSGPFKLSVMYGRLQKAVLADSLNITSQDVEPAYKRMGYGFKASYAKQKNYVDLILFKAKDDISSNPLNATITPQENVVTGINAGKVFFKRLLLSGELALSALTRNQLAFADSVHNNQNGFLLRTNNSTALYTAYKTALVYNGGRYTIGLGYERISPEYKTLGAYYFANDFENITGNLTTKLLKDKLSIAASTGIQHDDLRKEKQSSTQRFVGSLNLSYQANNKLNFNGSYSNFQSFVNIRSTFNQVNELTAYDNLDTLNYTQLSQNVSLNTNYILSQNKQKSQVLNFNLSYMTSADKQDGTKQNTGGNFYNLNSSFSSNFVPQNFSYTVSLNANRNTAPLIKTTTFGPTAGVNKSFLDKRLRSSFSTSWNSSYANGTKISSILNFRLNMSYAVKKKHNINLNMVALNSNSSRLPGSVSRAFNEFTTTLGYNYSFNN